MNDDEKNLSEKTRFRSRMVRVIFGLVSDLSARIAFESD